ncbi:MAG: hypothetical protein HKP58_03175 [Desulfatitalea sp.]|nr:hypothetical protein [Desulfatitalea sp.]NNJ99394.1 hypothetical protein [Desulfatitalea sp.]
MSNSQIFLIRLGLALFFGVLISRLLYPQAPFIAVISLCAVLVGLSYVSAYLRRRQNKK